VGEVVLDIDETTKKVVKSSARLKSLWLDETGSDTAAALAVEKLAGDVGHVYDVVLATASATLTRSRDGESSLGDWMADCSRAWAGADVAIQNPGGIRADLQAGPVTFREIFYVMPFENRVAKLVMKGRELRSLLGRGVSLGRLPQVSGASLTVRRGAASGQSMVSASVAGKPIQDDVSYTVSTLDFLAKGGDGYVDFEFAEKKEFTQTLMRDVLKWCAQKEALIKTPSAGRLVFVGD
jgi:2',3'-cyclic-nucleotide 2'-phosphodiesterase (5'-nucleotidase family)